MKGETEDEVWEVRERPIDARTCEALAQKAQPNRTEAVGGSRVEWARGEAHSGLEVGERRVWSLNTLTGEEFDAARLRQSLVYKLFGDRVGVSIVLDAPQQRTEDFMNLGHAIVDVRA